MDPNLGQEILIVVLMVAIPAFALGGWRRHIRNNAVREYWGELARANGLTLKGTRVNGQFRGRDIRLTVHDPGFSGRGAGFRGYCTRIQMQTDNPAGATLDLRRRVGPRRMHLRAISMDDEWFDGKVAVRANPREFAFDVLTNSLRTQAVLVLDRPVQVMVDLTRKGKLTYLQQNFEGDSKQLLRVLDFLSNLAAEIEKQM